MIFNRYIMNATYTQIDSSPLPPPPPPPQKKKKLFFLDSNLCQLNCHPLKLAKINLWRKWSVIQ